MDKYHYRNGKALFIGLALKSSIDRLEKNLGFIAEGRVKNRVAYLFGMYKKQGYELPHFKRGKARKIPEIKKKFILEGMEKIGKKI